ncbi:MAG: sugar transferase [Eubacteriaceae bacterium]|nr:sugar transferase [Eubacteriaceae bacterium]
MYIKYVKRIIDLILAFLLLPIVLPVIFILAIFIKLEDQGNVFYAGPRLGQYGRIFKMLKLRSMKETSQDIRNVDGSTYNGENDPRLTRIGRMIRKTSLDELPQVINVIKGEMSIVGPRADLPDHLALYTKKELRKLDVKPGITGYTMAYYRNSISWEEKKKYDCYYVNNISFWLDVRIFFKTIATVLLRKNIYIAENYNDKIKSGK